MGEVLKIATNVATPLALLGLVAALAFFAYNRRLKNQEKTLETLPEAERARITDEYLTRYNIDGSKLKLADKLALIRDEMHKRHQRSLSYVIVSAVVFVICFGLAVFAYVSKNSGATEPTGPELVSGTGSDQGYLLNAQAYLTRKDPDYPGMDGVIPHFIDLATRASGQFLCSAPVAREWTNPTVKVNGIQTGEQSPTVEALLFAPRGQPELQLHQSTPDIHDGVATFKFQGTLPAQGVVFVTCWVDGPDADPIWSDLSITLE